MGAQSLLGIKILFRVNQTDSRLNWIEAHARVVDDISHPIDILI